MRASIAWRRFEEGGRKSVPLGEGEPSYAAVIRFKDEEGPWPPEIAWNLVVRKVEEPTENRWIADVAFKASHAPHGDLVVGREFELYEGHKCVANGVLMADSGLHRSGSGSA